MNLVKIIHDDVFTDSMVIANGSGNQHESVVRQISSHREKFDRMGFIKTTDLKSGVRGPATTVYLLNEPQASFLITLLRNTDSVVDFKFNLVNDFYRMRTILWQRQTSEWLVTRKQGKLVRRNETDTLANLVEYAESQGSRNMRKQVCNVYSRLVNSLVNIEAGQRDNVPFKTISTIMFLEDMILHTVDEEMRKGTHYKVIYQICKDNGEQIMRFAYLPMTA